MNILMITSECAHVKKISGVGDVIAGLSLALTERNHVVKIIMPKYKLDNDLNPKRIIDPLEVRIGDKIKKCAVEEVMLKDKLPVNIIEYKDYFNKDGIFGPGDLDEDDGENPQRFAFLCLAALAFCQNQHFIPDVIHCHDWSTALIPAYASLVPHFIEYFKTTGIILTIHNMSRQGLYLLPSKNLIGLPNDIKELQYESDENYIHMLKAGITYANVVNTVSETFRTETLHSNRFGIEGKLREKGDCYLGIRNGVDYYTWSPEKDEYIYPNNYSKAITSNKGKCKKQLRQLFHLDSDTSPLLGAIGPINEKSKGFNLILEKLEDILKKSQFVLLGHGRGDLVDKFIKIKKRYPGRMGFYNGFDESKAHYIIAGCDFLLLPSDYEPCGLLQMYCQRYGTLPISRSTGGLHETVIDYYSDKHNGTGFIFSPPYAKILFASISSAVRIFHDKASRDKLIYNAMKREFPWEESVFLYEAAYRKAIERKGKSLQTNYPNSSPTPMSHPSGDFIPKGPINKDSIKKRYMPIAAHGSSARFSNTIENKPLIYISCVHFDKEIADNLRNSLMEIGLFNFIDNNSIKGREIDIEYTIRDCDFLIAILSSTSVDLMGREWDYAIDVSNNFPGKRNFITPVRIEECSIPPKFQQLEKIDLFPSIFWEEGVNKIVERILKIFNNG
jgi:starch synthase